MWEIILGILAFIVLLPLALVAGIFLVIFLVVLLTGARPRFTRKGQTIYPPRRGRS